MVRRRSEQVNDNHTANGHAGDGKQRRRLSPRPRSDYDNARLRRKAEERKERRRQLDLTGVEPDSLPADILLSRLRDVRPCGDGWAARCPAHADQQPSLSITETEDRDLLVHCHAGCKTADVMRAVGLDLSFLFCSAYARRHGEPDLLVRHGMIGGMHMSPDDSMTLDPGTGRESDWAMQLLYDSMVTAQKGGPKYLLQDEEDEGLYDPLEYLAGRLGIDREALEAIGVVYDPTADGEPRWAWPEWDCHRLVVGIGCRFDDGRKVCKRGSRRGLILHYQKPPPGPIHITEGLSDTAALVSTGAHALGRPAAQPSERVLAWLTSEVAYRWDRRRNAEVVVVADDDEAGLAGAEATAKALGVRWPSWFHDTVRVITDRREAILADARWHLTAKKPAKPQRVDRWADWCQGVLAKLDDPDKLLALIERRRGEVDGDRLDAEELREELRYRMSLSYASAKEADEAVVLIPVHTMTEWMREVRRELSGRRASQYLKQLSVPWLTYRRTSSGRFWVWRGRLAPAGKLPVALPPPRP